MGRYLEDFLDIGPGKVFYPGNEHIAYDKSLKQQISILREDMLQIHYGDDSLNYIVDVGWYGQSFSLEGSFIVCLIKNYDWQNPCIRVKCKSIKRLVPALNLCLNRVRRETDDYKLLSLQIN